MAIISKNQHDSSNGVKQDKFSNDEVEVAAILLDLPFLITKSLSNYRFDYNWGSKKPRSALNSPPSPPPRSRRKTPPPPPPPLPVVGLKREAASPNTPLSFSPSDSDSKSKKKPRLFLRKEELEQVVKERLDTQQQLKESIEKVEVYLKSLIAENSKLKATKQEMQMTMGKKRSEKELKLRMTACTTEQEEETTRTVNNDQVHAVASTSTASHHLTPLIQPHYHHHHHQGAAVELGDNHNDPMCAAPWQLYHRQPSIYHDHDYQVVVSQQQQQQHQPFDLNLSPEEAEREMRKRETDEARQHRYRIRKEKLTRVRP